MDHVSRPQYSPVEKAADALFTSMEAKLSLRNRPFLVSDVEALESLDDRGKRELMGHVADYLTHRKDASESARTIQNSFKPAFPLFWQSCEHLQGTYSGDKREPAQTMRENLVEVVDELTKRVTDEFQATGGILPEVKPAP